MNALSDSSALNVPLVQSNSLSATHMVSNPLPEETAGLPEEITNRLRRDANGLFAAVVQDYTTRDVLMLAWMDDEALARTLQTRRGTYFSRSRQQYWVKGETSGHTQYVRQARLDCDGDAVLLLVDQVGPACHNSTTSCFDTLTLLDEQTS